MHSCEQKKAEQDILHWGCQNRSDEEIRIVITDIGKYDPEV